ncbi:thioredoxin reductase-like protein [Halorubrum distributum JCM 9100]|uniref:Thioredoxin reductase-like protein n=2 Tax=Halorubrum distributum TaxID=29283 RepID=M0ETD7_9EURY|nr:FAD-dependent oxidoreductase [Halorubrum distributum]ELZ50368.1 thioredoxin reductase-like protein [Halorubrum distributum JCM 9100]ELZ54471.1 thioredoxin reductase-like protein [Halorubrum distributum JCM 10118]
MTADATDPAEGPNASTDDRPAARDVVVVGGGVAGLSAAVYTARQGLDTLVVDPGGSVLRRNARLENFPGFPLGVDARRLLDLLGEQAETAGADRLDARVTRVSLAHEGSDAADADAGDAEANARFAVTTDEGDRIRARHVVAATKNEVGYLEGLDGVAIVDRGKAYVDADERGRTGVDGLYAAGRIARKTHQAAVCAGHGAEVAVTLLEEAETPFYHDWVAPEGYFTDRDRDVPPGCEEIAAAEREARESAALDATRDRFAEPHPDPQETHPSLED